jgi:rSAM/selenodomain-associated transferase 1
MNKRILIMARPAELGKVKSRLAATLGAEKTLTVYKHLLHHTISITEKSGHSFIIWWSELPNDYLSIPYQLQTGELLGERMQQAFEFEFNLNQSEKVVMVGTDCPDLSTTILQQAFDALEENKIVLGPSEDGGYYLIGMNGFHPELLQDIEWSTDRVLEQTIEKCKKYEKTFALLPTLNDIDNEEDLRRSSLIKTLVL